MTSLTESKRETDAETPTVHPQEAQSETSCTRGQGESLPFMEEAVTLAPERKAGEAKYCTSTPPGSSFRDFTP